MNERNKSVVGKFLFAAVGDCYFGRALHCDFAFVRLKRMRRKSLDESAAFYAAKGFVEALFGAAALEMEVEAGARPFLHPGKAASVLAGDERKIGWIGELHPLVARAWDLEGAAAFEVDFDSIAEEAAGETAFRDVTTYPAVLQDIAVVVDDGVSAAEVTAAVRDGAGDLLTGASVFDVYEGEQVGEGRRSLALHLEFRAPDRTLTDEDADRARADIVAALGDQLKAVQRG